MTDPRRIEPGSPRPGPLSRMKRALRLRRPRGLVRTARRGLLVLEEDGRFLRAALVTGRKEALVPERVEPLEGLEALGRFESGFPGRWSRSPVLVVSSEVGVRLHGGPSGDAASLAYEVPAATRARWRDALAARGRPLAGLRPLAGAPLALLGPGERTKVLLLQVEHSLVAALELDAGRCTRLEIRHGPPTVESCRALVGDRPEVLLCGAGLDLSALGYAIARGGSTWVRILGARTPGGSIAGCAALLGAVRHVWGGAEDLLVEAGAQGA